MKNSKIFHNKNC